MRVGRAWTIDRRSAVISVLLAEWLSFLPSCTAAAAASARIPRRLAGFAARLGKGGTPCFLFLEHCCLPLRSVLYF